MNTDPIGILDKGNELPFLRLAYFYLTVTISPIFNIVGKVYNNKFCLKNHKQKLY